MKFIPLLVFFILIFGFADSYAVDNQTVVEISPEVFDLRDVPPLTDPVRIELNKNGEVDFSDAKKAIERIKDSLYMNSYFSIGTIKEKLLQAINLCAPLKPLSRSSECLQSAVEEFDLIIENIEKRGSDSILYERDYTLPGSEERVKLANSYVEKADFILDNNECGTNCDRRNVAKALILGSEAEYIRLFEKIKQRGSRCQKAAIRRLGHELRKERFPKKCRLEENKSHPVCVNKIKDFNTVRDRALQLMDMAYGPHALQALEAESLCLTCAEKEEDSFNISVLYKLLNDFERQSQCPSSLAPDKEKTVYPIGTGSGNSPYPVKRYSDSSYSVHFTLKFSADKDYDGPINKNQVHKHYLDRVKRCMGKANQKMLGPNGEKLRIVIKGPEESDNKCESVKNIRIGSKDHRSNASKYEENIDCPTITHEILHLTGLCDEYEERLRGIFKNYETGEIFADWEMNEITNSMEDQLERDKYLDKHKFLLDFNCRVTADNSIMSDQYQRWDNVFGTSYSFRDEKKEDKENSLLTPMQFNSILHGNCPGEHDIFKECSKLAYESSVYDASCLKEKQKCEERNSMGLDKQGEIKRLQNEINRIGELIKNETSSYYTKDLEDRLQQLRERLERIKSWPDN